MKSLMVTIQTSKGVSAIKDLKSKPMTRKDRLVVKAMFREKIISLEPLVIKITPKVRGVGEKLEDMITQAYNQYGLVEGEDYTKVWL